MTLLGAAARGMYHGENPNFNPKESPGFNNARQCLNPVDGEIVATTFNDEGDLFLFIQDRYGQLRRCAYDTVSVYIPGITIVPASGDGE